MTQQRKRMRRTARFSLAVVVALGGLLVLPRPASRVFAPDASAQVPTPTLPPIVPSSSPTSEPSPKPSNSPGGGGGGGGGTRPGGGSSKPGEDNERKRKKRDVTKKKRNDKDKKDRKKKRKKKRKKRLTEAIRIPGSYNTDRLVAVAAQLRALGYSAEDAMAKAFPPFIIGGEAAWIDTWGAPRFGPGPLVRTHQGQDVFCDYGAPVLATEVGRVNYSDGGLGGKTTRLFRADGSYYYYTHLSGWNEDIAAGSTVAPGDVIGYCGNSGNAATTPPHVHFGWYRPGGVKAINPMRKLIAWLRAAEARAGLAVDQEGAKRIRNIEPLTVARRFGDFFAPDRSELGIATESLYASGSSPATGALSLAQSALQAALAGSGFELGSIAQVNLSAEGAASDESALDPSSALAQLLHGRHGAASEAGD